MQGRSRRGEERRGEERGRGAGEGALLDFTWHLNGLLLDDKQNLKQMKKMQFVAAAAAARAARVYRKVVNVNVKSRKN